MMWPMRISIVLTLTFVFLLPILVRADEPRSVDVFKSANGKYELRLVKLEMVVNSLPIQRWSVIEKATNKTLYNLTERLAAFTVFVSNDGSTLIAVDDYCEDSPAADRKVLTFYINGKPIKRYSLGDLLDSPDHVIYSVSHFMWTLNWGAGKIDNGQYLITTLDLNAYIFDISTGEMIDKRRVPPPPLATVQCGDESYEISRIDKEKNRESKLVFVTGGNAKYTIPLPSDDDYQGFALNGVTGRPKGFEVSIEWGSRFYHQKQFVFECRDQEFYLVKIFHSTFDKSNPGKWSENNQTFKVRLRDFKITNFMQD